MSTKKSKAAPYAKTITSLRTAEQGLKEEYATVTPEPKFRIQGEDQTPTLIEKNLEDFASQLDVVTVQRAKIQQVLDTAKSAEADAKVYLECLTGALVAAAGPKGAVLAKTGLAKKVRAKPTKSVTVAARSAALKAKKAQDKVDNQAIMKSKGKAVLDLGTGEVDLESADPAAQPATNAAASTAASTAAAAPSAEPAAASAGTAKTS